MLRAALRKNKKAIRQGRLNLINASVDGIPFAERFGQIYAINTIYFWPDLKNGLRQIYDKLEKGGMLLNVCYTKQWLDKLGYTKTYKNIRNRNCYKQCRKLDLKPRL